MSALGAIQSASGRIDRPRLSASNRDEQDLVAAVRRGDDQAFGELYSRYGRRIVSYVFGMVGDHGRAEDIAQETFISALRRMRETERPIAFKPWIYEIAKNASIDEFRRTRRSQEVSLEADDESESYAREPVAGAPSPDAAFERRQQLDDLRGAFRGLSDNHHQILVMRELEGLSYAEIARRMGMTRPIVESTLFRARRRLGQEYDEIASGRRCEQVRAVVDAGGPNAVRALGVRERRRLTRHVSHCQPCRRYAWLAGVDDSVLRAPSVAQRIAALLPIPAFLRWRRAADDETKRTSGSPSVLSLQSVQTVAPLVGPASPASLIGRATAALAAIVMAGGGVVAVISSHSAPKPGQSKVGVGARSVGGPSGAPIAPGSGGTAAGLLGATKAATGSGSAGVSGVPLRSSLVGPSFSQPLSLPQRRANAPTGSGVYPPHNLAGLAPGTTTGLVPVTAPSPSTLSVATSAPTVQGPAFQVGAPQVSTGVPQVPSSTPQVPSGAPQVPSGTAQEPGGVPQVPSGTPQVPAGTPQVPTGTPQGTTVVPQDSSSSAQGTLSSLPNPVTAVEGTLALVGLQ